jgi:hypothetical protein
MNRHVLKAFRILVIRYHDGQLRRMTVIAPDRTTAETIAELRHGEVVG